jgi:hypothetical protein
MITDAFKKEIRKFDHERVIPAWDGLVARQQAELVQAHVPTMFVTGETANLEVSFFFLQNTLSVRHLNGPGLQATTASHWGIGNHYRPKDASRRLKCPYSTSNVVIVASAIQYLSWNYVSTSV